MGRCTGRGGDGRSRALRRRVTLIFGGYHGCPWHSTHDSASSGGLAVQGRALGRVVRERAAGLGCGVVVFTEPPEAATQSLLLFVPNRYPQDWLPLASPRECDP